MDLLVDNDTAMSVRDIRELRDVEAALERTLPPTRRVQTAVATSDSRGSWGYPTAARCIQCQTRFEKSHAGEGTFL